MTEPTKIIYSDCVVWRLDGKVHREDGPAILYNNGDETWCFDDQWHRVDGPAVIQNGGTKLRAWCVHGKHHRIDGPAVEASDMQSWFLHGTRHREDGYAHIDLVSGQKFWFLFGREFTEEEFWKRVYHD